MLQAVTLRDLLEALHQIFQLTVEVKSLGMGGGLAGGTQGGAVLILALGGLGQAGLAEGVSAFCSDGRAEELQAELAGEVALHSLHNLRVRHARGEDGRITGETSQEQNICTLLKKELLYLLAVSPMASCSRWDRARILSWLEDIQLGIFDEFRKLKEIFIDF